MLASVLLVSIADLRCAFHIPWAPIALVISSLKDIFISCSPQRRIIHSSRPIHSDRRVKVLEFDTCVGGCKLPVGLGEVGIAVVLPSGDFLDEGLLVGNPAVEALGRQDAEFRLCQIKPAAMLWSVVPFEALDQPPGFAGRKGFIK